MKFSLVSLIAAAVFAVAGSAQPDPQPLSGQLFIAPSGEPFRSDWGSPYPVASWFSGADSNHDSKLTQGEFVIDFARYFESLDLDHDGILSSAEVKSYETQLAPEVQSDDWNSGPQPQPDPDITGTDGQPKQYAIGNYEHSRQRNRPTGGARFGVIAVPEPIISMDLNFDGKVSRDEMLKAAQRRYQLLVEKQSVMPITLSGLPETWAQAHEGKIRAKQAKRSTHGKS